MNAQGAVYTNERGQDRKHTPWPLPAGWTWVSLDELGHWTGGGTPSKTEPSFWTDGTIPWVSPKDMKLDVIGTTEDLITEKALDRSATKLVPAGSVLMVMRSGILRHSFPVARTDRPVTLNQDLRALTPIDALDPSYLARYLARSARAVLDACSKDGTTVNSIDAKSLARFRVPVPPFAEQRRIVARIDALFEEIAEGERALDTGRKGLETYRRALLKAAVTGELTADWRETNDVDVSGRDIVRLIEHNLRLAKRRPAPSGEPAGLSRIPDTWAWSTLGTLASSVRNGTSAAPRSAPNGNEILRISAVRSMHIDATQIRYLNESQAAASADATVQSGDLLFTRYNGSADLVGVGAIYRGPQRFYPDKIIRVRLHAALEDGAPFVELAANAGAGRKHIAANIKTTAGQQGLSGESLKQTPIPVPPPGEAKEILRRVADGLAAASDTQHVLDAEASDVQRLRQSVLKAAFEGRLVPQDESEEPASVMLARIAASQEPAPRPRRGRPRAVAP